MQSKAETVDQYLDKLPEDRRRSLRAVREVILENLPNGFEEAMNWGMITYQVPLETFPDTYNKQPLMVAALASQKNHMALYLTAIYMDDQAKEEFKAAYQATGKRYDVGKSCVRFKTLEDLPLELIGKSVRSHDVSSFIKVYQKTRPAKQGKRGA
jgi:uncharacterized protein YdhG (YjbR/CyaY superfamily)